MNKFGLVLSLGCMVFSTIQAEEALPSFVKQQDDGYAVTLMSGKAIFLRHNPGHNENRELYRYVPSPLEPRRVLFNVGQYEGRYFMWVDRAAGKVLKIPNNPVFSPSKKRFAMAAGGDDINYEGCVVEIWKNLKEDVAREYALSCAEQGWIPHQPEWEGEEAITFQKDAYGLTGNPVSKKIRLVFNGKEWVEKNQ